MKREELEKILNKNVRVKLFNGDIFEGCLRKTGDDMFRHNNNLYIPKNRYFLTDDNLNCISCLFRVSHITKIEELN